MRRLADGGLIDRTQPLNFSFNGRAFSGFAGDTLASAMLANGISMVGRSFKYHRPRGIYSAGWEEPNALFEIGDGAAIEPTVRATDFELVEGVVARSQNAWPSLDFDACEILDAASPLLPAGFYYKSMIGRTWDLAEPWVRRMAGLGRAPTMPDPDRYARRYAHCDVLVIGGGAAGLAAARAAAAGGARVMLVEQDWRLGHHLGWDDVAIDGQSGPAWIEAAMMDLALQREVLMLARTVALGVYDHGLVTLLERFQPGGLLRQRLWQVRAKRLIVATGAIERGLPFNANDRPGIMLAEAARTYLRRFAVACGERAVIVTTNDSGYRAARNLFAAGVAVTAIVDDRAAADAPAIAAARQEGFTVYDAHRPLRALGRRRVEALDIVAPGGGVRRLDGDLIALAGGWSPTVNLFMQAGGTLQWDGHHACLRPAAVLPNAAVVGAANGTFALGAALREAHAAGLAAAAAVGHPAPTLTAPDAVDEPTAPTSPLWHSAGGSKVFIDLTSDVTERDVTLAARENYSSVEHLKRYTTLGMGPDQGRLANLPGLALLARETGREIDAVGTTTFRPPTVPVAFGAAVGEAVGDLLAPRRLLPAHDRHVALGALFEDFGAWSRPNVYPRGSESIDQAARRECQAARQTVVLFDASPLGKIEVFGPDAAEFLERVYVNQVKSLRVGAVRYGLMLNEHGTIIDDGVFARLADQHFLLSPSSGAAGRIAEWLEAWRQGEWPELQVRTANVTGAWGCLALAGPQARDVLTRLGGNIDLGPAAFPHMTIRYGTVAGMQARVSRVSFTGELQYEIAVAADQTGALWDAAMAAGAATPIGVEAWLRLRIDKGYIHVGGDTDGLTLPGDVGFGAAIARKAADFIGRRSLTRSESLRPDRERLVGLLSIDPQRVLPVGSQILPAPGATLPATTQGRVTSSAWSTALNRGVALARLRGGDRRIGETVELYHLGERLAATVVALPFYDPKGERLAG